MRAIVVPTLAFALLVVLLFAPVEHAFGKHAARRTGLRTDALFATLSEILARAGLVFGAGTVLALLETLAPERSWLPNTPVGHVLEVVLGLLLVALGGYVYHRLAHAVPFLFRLHAVHHSSEHLDSLAAFRRHPLEVVLNAVVQNAPVVLLGIPLGAHVAVIVLLRVNTIFVHTNLRVRLGPLRYLVATPDFHHRHHQRDGEPKNFSSIFPFIDHLFGTAAHEEAGPLGLREPMPKGFLALLLHPFRREPSAEIRAHADAGSCRS